VIQTSKFLQNVELNVDEGLAMQFDIEFVGQVAILKVYNVNFQNL
jgi:hypothetical protein